MLSATMRRLSVVIALPLALAALAFAFRATTTHAAVRRRAKVTFVKARLLAAAGGTYQVVPGDTLWGIGQRLGVSWQAVASANGIQAPYTIYAGQVLKVPGGQAGGSAEAENDGDSDDPGQVSQQSQPAPQQAAQPPAAPAGGGLSDVPGVPAGFAACVAFRESTDGQASSNVYGIIPASGYDVSGMSVAQQKQVFSQLYAQVGAQAWQPYDGC